METSPSTTGLKQMTARISGQGNIYPACCRPGEAIIGTTVNLCHTTHTQNESTNKIRQLECLPCFTRLVDCMGGGSVSEPPGMAAGMSAAARASPPLCDVISPLSAPLQKTKQQHHHHQQGRRQHVSWDTHTRTKGNGKKKQGTGQRVTGINTCPGYTPGY